VLITEPPVQDERLFAPTGGAQDGFLLGTEEGDPAAHVLAVSQRPALDAVVAVVQYEGDHKPADVICHRQQRAAPVVGAEGKRRSDARPERHEAPSADRHSLGARHKRQHGVRHYPLGEIEVVGDRCRSQLDAILLAQVPGDIFHRREGRGLDGDRHPVSARS
jgi:hypothetical protein